MPRQSFSHWRFWMPDHKNPTTGRFHEEMELAYEQVRTPAYTVRRNVQDHAEAIERDGYTVLILAAGAERNEQEVERIGPNADGALRSSGSDWQPPSQSRSSIMSLRLGLRRCGPLAPNVLKAISYFLSKD